MQIPVATSVAGDERITVQGVVDLAWVREGEIYLLDFKTDAVRAASVREKAEEYRPQLAIYALALERILRRPVTQRWLHFLTPRITLRLDV
jgi:ATP-dependent helicase/nuclease subunit A